MWFVKKRLAIRFDYEYDIHSHVLPGLDDGVKTLDEAVAVVKKMSVMGARRIACTPHVAFPSLLNSRETIQPVFDLLTERLRMENIPVELELGAEYRVGEYMLKLIEQGNIIAAGDGRVLLEHGFMACSPYFDLVIFYLQNKGFQVVLAHPERYVFYEKDVVASCEALKAKGCKLQVNILSFVGFYGKDVETRVYKLYKAGLVDYFAGDIHGLKHALLVAKCLEGACF